MKNKKSFNYNDRLSYLSELELIIGLIFLTSNSNKQVFLLGDLVKKPFANSFLDILKTFQQISEKYGFRINFQFRKVSFEEKYGRGISKRDLTLFPNVDDALHKREKDKKEFEHLVQKGIEKTALLEEAVLNNDDLSIRVLCNEITLNHILYDLFLSGARFEIIRGKNTNSEMQKKFNCYINDFRKDLLILSNSAKRFFESRNAFNDIILSQNTHNQEEYGVIRIDFSEIMQPDNKILEYLIYMKLKGVANIISCDIERPYNYFFVTMNIEEYASKISGELISFRNLDLYLDNRYISFDLGVKNKVSKNRYLLLKMIVKNQKQNFTLKEAVCAVYGDHFKNPSEISEEKLKRQEPALRDLVKETNESILEPDSDFLLKYETTDSMGYVLDRK